MRRSNITIADLRSKTAAHSSEVGQVDKYNGLWGHVVLRGASFYPAWLFLRLGISGNMVTRLSFVTGCIGCGLLAFSSYHGMIIGAVLINIWLFLDFVDGTVARGSNSSSKYGRFLDHFNDITSRCLLFFALGIAAFNHTDSYLNWLTYSLFGMTINQNIFLILGGWTAVCRFGPSFLINLFNIIFSHRLPDFHMQFGMGNPLLTLIRRLLGNLRSAFTVILLFAVMFRFLGIFLLFYALLHTAAAIYDIVRVMNTARATGQ